MASRASSRGRSSRETSPNSPLTPLSPSTLPQWLRSSRPRHRLLSNGKLKMLLLATGCLVLGWMVTSSLGSTEDMYSDVENGFHDTSSVGVLEDPSGFGKHVENNKRPGIIGGELKEDHEAVKGSPKEPSVSGALSDLHHAVSDKIQSWNPYFVKSAHRKSSTNATKTHGAKSGKNDTTALLNGETVKDGIGESERLGARTRIGKCTILFHGNDFWERCIRTHERHDKYNGYRLHVLRQELMDDVWSKPAYILSLLLRELAKPYGERLDWLFWVDSDTVILNPYIPIETFLPPPGTEFDDIYLMYSMDWNGLNNGVFPIRVNQWAANMFASIVAYRQFHPEENLQFRDQSVMNTLMQQTQYAKHIMQAPQRWFNAYQGEHNETLQPFQVRRGDLLVHFAGIPAREERMQYWLERAEQHLDDWEVPVKSTSYPQEARDFWNEQKEIRANQRKQLEDTKEKATKLLSATDQQLIDYGDRLSDEQKEKISKLREDLKNILDDEKNKDDHWKIIEFKKNLTKGLLPLSNAVTEANKVLLDTAHQAIFSGEKDLLDGGFNQGTSSPELQKISTTVKNLKTLVMAPEEFWSRSDIIAATNAVTEARARLQAKVTADLAEEMKEAQVQADSVQLLEDAKNAVQKQADEFAWNGSVTPVEPLPNAAEATVAPAVTAVLAEDAASQYDEPAAVESASAFSVAPTVADEDESTSNFVDNGPS